jgi:putative aldouronate transport system permease protein
MKVSKGRIIFQIFNYAIMFLLTALCLFPLLNVLAMSFSSATAVSAGRVSIFPVELTISAYKYVIERKEFWVALLKSIERVCIGVPLSMLITILTAYPLSKDVTQLRARSVYAWLFFFTMLFSGGLIPGYLLIQKLHLMDTIWALVLPTTVSVYNIVLMLNFFRGIPKELEEAALTDGASQFRTCFQIYVPCAKPSIATLTLFSFITQWNSYFDGLVFSNFPSNYPLASYLYTVVVQRDMSLLSVEEYKILSMVDDRTIRCAQIFISMLPIMLVYPFAQKYFVSGITVGSVKG